MPCSAAHSRSRVIAKQCQLLSEELQPDMTFTGHTAHVLLGRKISAKQKHFCQGQWVYKPWHGGVFNSCMHSCSWEMNQMPHRHKVSTVGILEYLLRSLCGACQELMEQSFVCDTPAPAEESSCSFLPVDRRWRIPGRRPRSLCSHTPL